MSFAAFLKAAAPGLLEQVLAEQPSEQAAKALRAYLEPALTTLVAELELDEKDKRSQRRAGMIASLAVDLVDSVVIPDDEEAARAMALRAVKLARYILDEAAKLSEDA